MNKKPTWIVKGIVNFQYMENGERKSYGDYPAVFGAFSDKKKAEEREKEVLGLHWTREVMLGVIWVDDPDDNGLDIWYTALEEYLDKMIEE